MSLSPREWAAVLKSNWDRRAASPHRDFYIASINDPHRWQAQGEVDVRLMLHGLDEDRLRSAELLEVGCGVGRLVAPLLNRVRAYTGFDISEVMLAEARRRCAHLSRARLFPSDGISVPRAARDREYDLVIALAVFIHCPVEITASLVRSAYSQLKTGGQLRFQLLANPDDTSGLESPAMAEPAHQEILEMENGATREQLSLIEGTYYMGHAFAFTEVQPWLTDLTGGRVYTFRPDLGHIYGWIEKV